MSTRAGLTDLERAVVLKVLLKVKDRPHFMQWESKAESDAFGRALRKMIEKGGQ
jgi:hypothetical protein